MRGAATTIALVAVAQPLDAAAQPSPEQPSPEQPAAEQPTPAQPAKKTVTNQTTVARFPLTPVPAEGGTIAPPLPDNTRLAIRIYASARVDVAVSTARMQDLELPMWALSEDAALGGVHNVPELTSHPWLTRVGASLDRWQLSKDAQLFGRIELDFLQETDSTLMQPRFLHGYAGLNISHWSLLLGHTNDLVAPLFPSVNSASMMWNAGNLGDRRLQLRASFEPTFGDTQLRIATAAGMPNTAAEQDLDKDGISDGLEAVLPVLGQGLVELRGHYWTDELPFIIGASGHVALQEVDDVPDVDPPPGAFDYDGARRLHGFSFVGHVQIPILDNLWLRGEGFYGQNLPEIRGGIGETISLATGQEVRAFGGWGELGLRQRWWTGIVGGSLDHPLDGDVATGQRRRNATFFAASHFRPSRSITIAIEAIHWGTAYQDRGGGSATRFNLWSSVDF